MTEYERLLYGAKRLMSAILLDVTRDYVKELKALYRLLLIRHLPPETRKELDPERLVLENLKRDGDIGYHARNAKEWHDYLKDHADYYGDHLIRKVHEKIRTWTLTGEEPVIGKRNYVFQSTAAKTMKRKRGRR